jgi:hypothetical protein
MSHWLEEGATPISILATVAALILFLGIVGNTENKVGEPEAVTTVTEAAKASSPGPRKTKVEVVRKGKETTKTTTTEKGSAPAQPAKTTTTVEKGQRTFLERVLGEGGLKVLQWAIAVLAAFLVGAFVQKVLLGDYSIKFGGLEIGKAADVSAKALEDLKTQIKGEVGMLATGSTERDVKLLESLELAYRRIDLNEKELAALQHK